MKPNIGRYQIKKFIGSGAAGNVYLAYDTHIKRDVALKLLTSQSANMVLRFRQEAELLAILDHPNIVPVFDVGEDNNSPYIIMPYLNGGTLKKALKTRKLSLSEIWSIVSQICDAMDHAHLKGIIHRDLKPANILFNHSGKPLIADFGISKIYNQSSKINLTQGNIIGTPHYMSPEQIRGQQLNHQTDIYSLGVILFEMCNGYFPFYAESISGIYLKHLNEPIPSMENLPPQVSQVIRKAMAKEKTHRYESMAQLSVSLRQAIGASAGNKPTSLPRVNLQRNTILSLLSGAMVVLVLIIITAVWQTSRNGPEANQRPNAPNASGSSLASNVQSESVIIPEETSMPQPTLTPTSTSLPAADFSCSGAPRTRLNTGFTARVAVTDGTPNSIRDAPASGTVLGISPEQTTMKIIDGPVCDNERVWWYVDTETGYIGWTAEGRPGEYWLEPVN